MFEEIVEAMGRYEVILEPDEDTPEWWAGAPSVVRSEEGMFYLACRMREGRSPRGKRGYEIRILKSADGHRFEPINHLRREDAQVDGFERPAIVRDPSTGKYKLYGCAGIEHRWSILKFDDVDDPAQFDARTARALAIADCPRGELEHIAGYSDVPYSVKDPVVLWDRGLWHMFVIGKDRIERAYHFSSQDGESWWVADETPVLENRGWHSFYTRPSSVVPMTVGYLFVYEGSNLGWHDPVYNIATGLAYSPDLRTFIDLTPNEPLLKSTTPGDYHTWRYSHWMVIGERMFVYFEAARPNNTNEIRLGVVELGRP